MTKILLIVPPYKTHEAYTKVSFNESHFKRKNAAGEDVYVSDMDTDMPLGVLSISAYLKKECKDVKIDLIDFNVEINKLQILDFDKYEVLFERILSQYKKNGNEKLDYVGVSALFVTQYESLLSLGKIVKKTWHEAFLVAGGGVPTTMYKDIYSKTNDFDALCLGEGEIPWKSLIKAEEKEHYLENAPAWATKEKVDNDFKFSLEYIEDLDEIPFLDYELCNLEDYAMAPAARRFGEHDTEKRLPVFMFMGSRGCPNHCCFCASHAVHGRKMRYYSLERIKEDLTKLKEKYKTENLVIQDDHFMSDKKRAYSILKIFHDLGLKPIFQNALAMYALDYDFLKALKEYGIDLLVLPIESGSQKVLKDIMHKPLNLQIIERVVNDCRRLGIYTNANILIGLPGETKQDIEDAILFLKTVPVNWYNIHIATPLPGSEMYEICKKNGYLKDEDDCKCDFKNAHVTTEDFTAEYILQKSYEMNLELNFVYNSDYRLGNYKVALEKFLKVIKVTKNHYWAHFMVACCYEKLGDISMSNHYMKVADEILELDEQQRYYANLFTKEK